MHHTENKGGTPPLFASALCVITREQQLFPLVALHHTDALCVNTGYLPLEF